ncbi:M23 family metallopeptidase [Amycolatopsis magusensis]|uniref:Murein DD-endopeptidase MepM/ murein hydrolase activator NlpD n=1 Tax=Amycolatopsis magusensis TaxID=882444 RepID=A0ABS4Q306_9PSEU|nr:M23 family metallopeptidase [Amycolatopsis magusensis]MBP2186070.1 murein DD-endopeptidase MepM/ murein hydrolase activator NlpD [Amycolatopsis magusensis]
MSVWRRLAAVTATIALPALGLVAAQGTASAAPNFQVPFKCGVTVTAATFSGHSPANSVDFQKSGITGMPVVASAAGKVTVVGNTGSTSYGRWIEIDHGSGWRTRYAHLSSQEVSVGQQVALGKQIGKAGATGGVTGPHLHFEQRLNGVAQKAKLNGVAVPYYGHTNFTSKNNCGGGGNNPYTPEQVCGTGFDVVDSANLGTSGTAYLLYNAGNANNCVATLKSVSLGTASATSAFLEVEGSARVTDSGNFTYYAGPVKKAAEKTCVKWGGSVGSASYTSPFEHCG